MRLPAFYRWLLLVVGLSISGISLAQDAGWPRQIQDSRGVHTLDHKPARIVSTSVTLTGSLLAIDAPVSPAEPLRRITALPTIKGLCASGAT